MTTATHPVASSLPRRPGPILAASGKPAQPPLSVTITPEMVASVTSGQIDDLLDRLIDEHRWRASRPDLREGGIEGAAHRQTMRDLAALIALRELAAGALATAQHEA